MNPQRGLFDPRPAPALHRRRDPPPALEAARAIAPRLTELQRRVLDAFRHAGPTSARALERLECFADLGFSTVRKRVCELEAIGQLVRCGEERESGRTAAAVYRVATTVPETTSGSVGNPPNL